MKRGMEQRECGVQADKFIIHQGDLWQQAFLKSCRTRTLQLLLKIT